MCVKERQMDDLLELSLHKLRENCNCGFDSFCEAYGCFEMYTVIITSTFVLILPRLFILPEMTDISVGILL